MPEERDPREYYDDDSQEFDDDDVPFHLPPTPDDNVEADVTDTLGKAPRVNLNAMNTMRNIPKVPSKAETLPGSDGLDPNPDMIGGQHTQPHSSDFTVEHQAESGATMPHQAQSGATVPHPVSKEHERYAPPAQSSQPATIPAPPAQQGRSRAQVGQPPAKLPRRKKKRRGFLGIPRSVWAVFMGLLLTFCGGLTLLLTVTTVILSSRLTNQLEQQLAPFDNFSNFQSTFFLDRNGTTLFEAFGEGRRTNIPLEQMPQALIDATVATEDNTFWGNPGVDVPATIRAGLQFVGLQEGESGGSTITQQLVRNVIFDFEYRAERSVRRKGEEILLAILLNQKMDKQEILEMYLNEIYYGNLAYGAEAAANTFFNKSAADLTLGEAALLAGLPQAPADLDPLNPDPAVQAAVEARWRGVLDRMVEEGYITDAERNEALRQGLTFSSPEVPLRAPHFTVYAQGELERMVRDCGDPNLCPLSDYTPDDITNGGWQVYTTVDLSINDLAQQAVAEQVNRLRAANNVSNGAVVVLKPITGEILGMVGSANYNDDSIDGRVNVTVALRQPGSTMKPFTYSAAMEQGMTPGDVIWDTPTDIGIPGQPTYTPLNYDRRFHGPMRMRHALANSYNVPAVQTLRRVGVENLLALMRRFGVETLNEDPSVYGLSLTLGGGEVSLLELTNAYAVFSRQGLLVQPTSILCILDRDDNIIYQYEDGCPRGSMTERSVLRRAFGSQVLDPRIAFIISDILSDNDARSAAMGPNSALHTPGIISSVKTGTTNDVKDNWTVGYTRNVAIGVWVGNSDGTPMVNSSGLTGAAPIWNTVLTTIYNNQSLLGRFAVDGVLQNDQLQPPGGVSLRRICDVRTLRDPATGCNSTISEWFLDGPAGIPQPDGSLFFPQPQPPPQPQRPSAGTFVEEVDPGIFRTLVQPIPEQIATAIQFSVAPGQPNPLPPLYCQVPIELAPTTPGVREQWFIAPPPVPEDAIRAEQYARNNGFAFLPNVACSPELLSAAANVGPTVITAVITQPSPGQVLSDVIPIIGTVQFSPEQAQFYKLEIRGGQFGGWTTIGNIHSESVVNGQLETLFVPGLQPGDYELQLAVVGFDGNYVQQPYTVPFRVQ
ncbi:MAG: hypothetical protein D6737_00095 [Chloroflexi bacterium]|nr:MAG: hypothetical protein D6737_00095 [Chloroflexota bacterium]